VLATATIARLDLMNRLLIEISFHSPGRGD